MTGDEEDAEPDARPLTGPHPAVAAARNAVRELLDGSELGTRVWVACSGGPDSLALAAAAAFVSITGDGDILVGHALAGIHHDQGHIASIQAS